MRWEGCGSLEEEGDEKEIKYNIFKTSLLCYVGQFLDLCKRDLCRKIYLAQNNLPLASGPSHIWEQVATGCLKKMSHSKMILKGLIDTFLALS